MEKINQKIDYEAIRAKALGGPRVTTLLQRFEDIAMGEVQVPTSTPTPEPEFLAQNEEYRKYYEVHKRNLGVFNRHGLASVPFLLEECIRTGLALSRFASARKSESGEQLTFYGTSCADGTYARTLAEYSKGRIVTLTDSPNPANQVEFRRLLNHPYSFFHLGPFVDITPEYLANRADPMFRDGFDVIWENTTFQMYGNNRFEQIAYVKRLLKEAGLMIFCEKMNHPDPQEYERMEKVKDDLFKAKYFTGTDIAQKKTSILSEMTQGQVTLSEFSKAVRPHFKHAYVIWNSTNFYEIVASNDKSTIDMFLSLLPEPYVPGQFSFEDPIVKPLFVN